VNWRVIYLLPLIFALTGCPWDDKKTPANPEKTTHDSFVGKPPSPSKPYNVMDYTKPPPKQ
jgi:hypothetical protein